MKRILLYGTALIGMALVSVGCNREPAKPGKPNQPAAKDHKHGDHKDHKDDKKGEHAHKPGPHGGIIVSLGADSYHAEAVFTKDGKLKLYTLGKDETKAIDVESQVLKAHVQAESVKEAVEMELKPVSGGKAGRTAEFVGDLPKELKDKKVTVTIPSITIGGEQFRIVINSDDAKIAAEQKELDEAVKAERAKLSPPERKLVDAQEWCVVMTDHRLGEMGAPIKLMVKDHAVFLCCVGCRTQAQANADKTLAKVEELKVKAQHKPAQKKAVKIGDVVPDFSITKLDGNSVKLTELQKDKKETTTGVIVLSYWCSTCHSCRHVEAHLAKLVKDFQGRAIVLALDANSDDSAEKVHAFLKKHKLAIPVALDPNGDAADLFGITKTTTTLVIDGAGVLRYCGQLRQKKGASAEDALIAVLAGNDVAVPSTPQIG